MDDPRAKVPRTAGEYVISSSHFRKRLEEELKALNEADLPKPEAPDDGV